MVRATIERPRVPQAGNTARFWFYVDCDRLFVRFTLRAGETLELTSGGAHEEGYSCASERITHTGAGLLLESAEWGRDCDGGHGRDAEYYCPLNRLRADESPSGYPVPAWDRVTSYNYDQFAELAGY